jgi:CRISPR-associated protein Cas6/Cse3/CasE subtype I-E
MLVSRVKTMDVKRFLSLNNEQHKTNIWSFFPGMKERNFLFKIGSDGYYIVSDIQPYDITDKWIIKTEQFSNNIENEMLSTFNITFNFQKRDPKTHKCHGIIKDAFLKYKMSNIPPSEWPTVTDLAKEKIKKWFEERVERFGFVIEEVCSIFCDKISFTKEKTGDPVAFDIIDVSGILKVTNVEKFSTVLRNGIGKGGAYGLGLLITKRI